MDTQVTRGREITAEELKKIQLEILDEYLSSIELTVPDTILAKILDGQEDAITYQASSGKIYNSITTILIYHKIISLRKKS